MDPSYLSLSTLPLACTCCRALVVEDRKTASGVAHINFFGGFWSGFLRSLDVRGVFARV